MTPNWPDRLTGADRQGQDRTGHSGLTARPARNTPDLYTADEAATILRVKKSWLERQAADRKIPFTLLGGRYRFSAAHITEIVLLYEHPPAPRHEIPLSGTRVRRARTPKGRAASSDVPLRARPRDSSRGVS